MAADWETDRSLQDALRSSVAALGGPDRTLGADDLEVAVLSRMNGRRAFRRIGNGELQELLGSATP